MERPLVTDEQLVGYQSASKGRKVHWPYTPRNRSEVPVNLWLNL